MLMSPSLALTSLRQIAPNRAHLTQIMLALLNAKKETSQLPLVARVTASDSVQWAICGHGVWLRVEVANECAQVFCENRLAEIVDALDAAEPILSELERRSGIVLDPVGMVSVLPDNTIVFEVASLDHKHLIHLALASDFAVPPSLQMMFDTLETDWSKVPVAFEVQVYGPALDVETAATIEGGDLVLIGGQAAATRLIWPAEAAQTEKIFGRYNMFSGEFIANGTGEAMEPGAADGANGKGSGGFSVPISIRLPNRMASASELSTMEAGTIFNIGAVTQGLPVSLLVGEQEIARGELVQVGDQFAVMIAHKTVHNEPQTGLFEPDAGAE